MIYCEFRYCIYFKRSKCILGTISISPMGMCEDCIIPDVDKVVLDKLKKETLEKLNARIIKVKR